MKQENTNIQEELTLKKFELLTIIGEGAFGKVKMIEDKKTKKQYALKYINKAQCIKEDSTTLIFRERMMLQEFKHPYIVGLRYAFQDDENLFIGLELQRGGDLRFTMNKKTVFDDWTLKVYMAELGEAINYMHSLQYIHRDLKPENILLNDNGHLCVTDLNLATSLKKRKPTSRSGTLDYMAPEMFEGKPYAYSIDWWAMGTILYELIYQQLPFDGGKHEDEITEYIRTKRLVFPEKSRHKTPVPENKDRNDFIKGLLQRDITKRLGSSNEGLGFETDIKTHPFLSGIDWQLIKDKKLEPKIKPNVKDDAMNFSAILLIEDMLGGDQLAYKPRKKKRDPNSKSFSQKVTSSLSNLFGIKSKSEEKLEKPKPKTKEQIEMEHMDKYWTDYDYELPDQKPMELPSSRKREESQSADKLAGSTSQESVEESKDSRLNQSMVNLGSNSNVDTHSRSSSVGRMVVSKSLVGSANPVDEGKQKNKSPLREAITVDYEKKTDFVSEVTEAIQKLGNDSVSPGAQGNAMEKERPVL